MPWNDIEAVVNKLSRQLLKKQIKLTSAESCTGGLISSCLTALPGASNWFERGFVSYSNESKEELLQVPRPMIQQYGAVSKEVAIAMAIGALANSHADVSLSVTGIAGPTSDDSHKPVGLVHFAWAGTFEDAIHEEKRFLGNRTDIRQQTCYYSLQYLSELLVKMR